MTMLLAPKNQPESQAAARLREAIVAILATVPNASDCISGLDTTFYRVLERRYLVESGDMPEPNDIDPTFSPWWSALPGTEREKIVVALDSAIDDSGLDATAADQACFAALAEIEDGARLLRGLSRRRRAS